VVVKVVGVDGESLLSLVVDSRLTWWFQLPPQYLIVDGGDVEPSPPSGTRTPPVTREFKKLCFKTRLNPYHVVNYCHHVLFNFKNKCRSRFSVSQILLTLT